MPHCSPPSVIVPVRNRGATSALVVAHVHRGVSSSLLIRVSHRGCAVLHIRMHTPIHTHTHPHTHTNTHARIFISYVYIYVYAPWHACVVCCRSGDLQCEETKEVCTSPTKVGSGLCRQCSSPLLLGRVRLRLCRAFAALCRAVSSLAAWSSFTPPAGVQDATAHSARAPVRLGLGSLCCVSLV